jgi:hypothetical protein
MMMWFFNQNFLKRFPATEKSFQFFETVETIGLKNLGSRCGTAVSGETVYRNGRALAIPLGPFRFTSFTRGPH